MPEDKANITHECYIGSMVMYMTRPCVNEHSKGKKLQIQDKKKKHSMAKIMTGLGGFYSAEAA